MKFSTRAKVTGFKASKGQMENGTVFDSTKFFVETDLDDSKGMAKGKASTEYTFGKSDEYERWKHIPTPVDCDIEFELVTSGKAQKTLISSIKPIEMSKPAAKGV